VLWGGGGLAESLLVLGQTCAWLYGVVVMDRTLVMAKLLDRLGAEVAPNERGHGGEAAQRAACWAMVSRSMAQHATRPPLAGIAAFEKVFHLDAPRMAVCSSIRLFPLPKALSFFRTFVILCCVLCACVVLCCVRTHATD
jgi:hypothetical protein